MRSVVDRNVVMRRIPVIHIQFAPQSLLNDQSVNILQGSANLLLIITQQHTNTLCEERHGVFGARSKNSEKQLTSPVYPSIRKEQFSSHWAGVYEM